DDARTECTGPGVDLGLRQVERVLTLDGTTAHVVARNIPEDLAVPVDDETDLGLGHVPPGIRADADRLAVSDDPLGGRLEEDLRAVGVVDELVHVRVLGLLRAPVPAAQVGDTGRPDLLAIDRSQHRPSGRTDPSLAGALSRLDPF